MKDNNLTEGKIISSLIKFALPVLLALFLQALYGGIDLLIVGRFGQTADVSGVSTGSMVMQMMTTVITGLTMGITILVGQSIGEKNPEKVGKVIGGGIFLFLIIGLMLSAIAGICAYQLSVMMHAPEDAFTQTFLYIRICGFGFLFVVAYNVLGGNFRGLGDSQTPLAIVEIACAVNIFGDVILVKGLGMGAAGREFHCFISDLELL